VEYRMKENSAGIQFGWYEILRILVPGFYFIFVSYVYAAAFTLSIYPFDTWEIGIPAFFIGGLLAGLTLYAKESPKKRKAFQSNQPSQFILERSRRVKDAPAIDENEARQLYFYILNHYIPESFQEKIFFFGTIYHTMISIRRTSFAFGVVGLVLLAVDFTMKSHFAVVSVLPVALVWLLYAMNVRYNKADRKMQENYQDQIFWLSMNTKLVDDLIAQRMHLDRPA
jgi:membrane protein implicated in regulation of membrane protease activity